jgi:drug/metabolite transporter (DMT)-like permease
MAPFSTALLMCYWEKISKVDIFSLVGASIGVVIFFLYGDGQDSQQLE